MNDFKACFIGLGYIGLPTAIIAADRGGVQVVGVDINPAIVDATNAGRLHFIEPGMEEMLKKVVNNGSLRASTSPEPADAFFIVVPTPFKGDHLPDISYVEAATRSVIPHIRPGNLFIVESTSPMGTTEQMADLIFAQRPELKGKIFIAYCPERVLPGNVVHELVNNDRVIGGIDPQSTDRAVDFYARFVTGKLHRTNARTAEMCKLTENSSRDVQIAFANELSMICDKAGINVWELISLANKHPRVNILWPGCGVGGHCIAVDPYFITAAYPNTARIIATAREINNHKSDWCEEKIKNAILRFRVDHGRLPRIALMGLAFKPDIDDLRESPAKKIALNILKECHDDADFMVVEPNISNFKDLELYDYRKAYDNADIVVFLTAHTPFKSLEVSNQKVELDFCGVRK